MNQRSRGVITFVSGFLLGVLVGGMAVKKGCPPVPVPADHDPPPVTSPASTGAAK